MKEMGISSTRSTVWQERRCNRRSSLSPAWPPSALSSCGISSVCLSPLSPLFPSSLVRFFKSELMFWSTSHANKPWIFQVYLDFWVCSGTSISIRFPCQPVWCQLVSVLISLLILRTTTIEQVKGCGKLQTPTLLKDVNHRKPKALWNLSSFCRYRSFSDLSGYIWFGPHDNWIF